MKNKLIILTPGFPKDEEDSTCLPHIQQLILSFIKLYSAQSIDIITFQYPYNSNSYYWHGVKINCIGGKNKSKLHRLLTWIKAYRLIKKIQLNFNIIGVFSVFHTECALVGSIFCRRNNIKHISWLQGQDAKIDNPYVKRIKAKSSELAALSDFLQQEFEKNHNVKPKHIINNGITENDYPLFNTKNRNIDILGVGSLIPLKNYTLFIEIIMKIKESYPRIKTAIAGDGVEKELLQKLINDNDLQENIELLGLISHTEVLKLMSDSKILLHTSNYEGSCSVIFEALYSGCHVASICNPSNLIFNEFFHSTDNQKLQIQIEKWLLEKTLNQNRIFFNTMDNSAKKIMDLYL